MGIGSQGPVGHAGSKDYNQGEPYGVDPSIAPGLPRPIGWRVLLPDGLGAWDKFGPNDTDWTPVGTSSGGTGVTSINTQTGAGTIDSTSSSLVVTTSVPVAGTFKIDLSQIANADWALGIARVYAIDTVNGNDANKGWADPATSSAADYAIACAAAGAVARKTIAGLGLIFPRNGGGRNVEIVIRNGGVNTEGAYADALQLLLGGCVGWNTLGIRATGTNTTAGCVAFDGSVADVTYQGAITVAGLNAPGYNPSGASTTSLPCVLAGGGAPALPAEPAAPLGWRVRFDAATATAGLRNQCRQIAQVSGGTTIVPQTAFSNAPGNTDVFYIEQAGVSIPASTISVGAGGQGASTSQTPFNFSGIRCTGTLTVVNSQFRVAFAGCNTYSHVALGCTLSVSQGYTSPCTILGIVTVGGGLHVTTSATIQQNDGSANMVGLVSQATTTILSLGQISWGSGCYAGGLFVENVQSNSAFDSFGQLNIGAVAALAQPRCTSLTIAGSQVQIGGFSIAGAGATPAIRIRGRCVVIFGQAVVSGSTGNTDVGLDLQNSAESLIVLSAGLLPTVTGTVGDVRWAGQALSVWTNYNFQEGWDSAGNHITEQTTNAEYKFSTSRSVALGVNNSGAAISAAYELVRNNGTNLQFVPAQADTAAHAASFFGVCEAVVQNGAAGLVAAPEGLRICQFDGAPVVGGIVYLSPTTAGLATTTIPALSGTNQKLRLGVCVGNSFPGSIGLVRWNPENIPVLADGLA